MAEVRMRVVMMRVGKFGFMNICSLRKVATEVPLSRSAFCEGRGVGVRVYSNANTI
jgi:hypothetical protein